MRYLFLTLAFSFQVHAAYVSCVYLGSPCDDKGDQYFCSMYGWGNFEYCSPTDNSRGPIHRTVRASLQDIVSDENAEEPANFGCADCNP